MLLSLHKSSCIMVFYNILYYISPASLNITVNIFSLFLVAGLKAVPCGNCEIDTNLHQRTRQGTLTPDNTTQNGFLVSVEHHDPRGGDNK